MDQTTIQTCHPITPGYGTTTGQEGGGLDADVQDLSRLQLLNEWIRNESEFLACLDSVQQQITSPILDRVYMDPSCCDILPGLPIFLSTVKILQTAHSEILQQLTQLSRSWCDRSSTIGDVISCHIGIIRTLLRPYSYGVGIVTACIRRFLHHNEPQFMPALQAAELREESLKSLSTPLNRLPYYEFMLRRLLNRTDLDHADHGPLSRATKLIRNACLHVAKANEFCRHHQSICALEQILDMNLIRRKRVLLLQGELICSFNDRDSPSPVLNNSFVSLTKLFSRKRRPFLSEQLFEQSVFVVLFNDIMVLSRKLPEGMQSIFDVIPLHSCSISVSESFRQKVLNVKCCDGRVYHLHSLQSGESCRWVESVLKAQSVAIKKTNDTDEFRIDVVYRNEYCQLRIVQQSVIISDFDEERQERTRLEVHSLRLFSDDADNCMVQLSSPSKHIIVFAKNASDAHRIIEYVKMEQKRIRSLLATPPDCCERAKSRSIQSNHESCSFCNSYIVCSSCLNAASLLSVRGKTRAIACKSCRMMYLQRVIACSIQEVNDHAETDHRDWLRVEHSKTEINFYEARRIRHNRRLGVIRLAELDMKPLHRMPRFEPDGCISAPLLKLRDDLCMPPKDLPISKSDVRRTQCASCLEFKSVNSENRFCGVCGHAESVVNDRVAFLFSFHNSEKVLVKQQICLFNHYLSETLYDLNEPAYASGLIYRPPSMATMMRFDQQSPSFVETHLSFMLEGNFIRSDTCRQTPGRNSVNSGAAFL